MAQAICAKKIAKKKMFKQVTRKKKLDKYYLKDKNVYVALILLYSTK